MTVSRDQFDETKNWTEPQWQEGVPVMDADLNLAMKIEKTGLRRAVCDFLGNGSPNDGFKLSGLITDPTISAGNIWVAGLKLDLPEDIQASAQPNAPVTFSAGNGVWYLDVVEKLLTNADDPAIRDYRLPANVETPIKVWKTDWTLRKALGASLPTPEPDHYHLGIALEAGGVLTDIRNTGMILAGADTGYQNRTGGRPGGGHRHRDEDVDVANPNYTGDTLEEVLNEIDSRIEVVEGDVGVVAPHAASHEASGADPVAHNGLAGLQGGSPTERYHLMLDLYNAALGAAGANAANPFATIADITGVAAKFAPPVQTIQNLRDVPPADLSDKQVRLVEDKGALYRFDETGAGTDDGDGIITPTSGAGRWFKMSSAVPDLSTVLAKGNSAGSLSIRDLPAPVNAADAATKGYVDANAGGATRFSELVFEPGTAEGLYSDSGGNGNKYYGFDFTAQPRGKSPYNNVYYLCIHPTFYNVLQNAVTLFHGIHLGVNLSGEDAVEEIRDFYFGIQSNGAAHASLKHTRCFYPDFTGQALYAAILNLPAMLPGEKWSHAHVRDGGPLLITRGTNIGENKTTNPSEAASGLKIDGHTVADMIAALALGVTDHGVLTGLGDDDHTQYLNTARHNAIAHGALADVMSPSEHTATNHAGLPGIGAVGNAIKTIGTGGDYATLQDAVAAHPLGDVEFHLMPETFTVGTGATLYIPKGTVLRGIRGGMWGSPPARSGTLIKPADPEGSATLLNCSTDVVLDNIEIETRRYGSGITGDPFIHHCSVFPSSDPFDGFIIDGNGGTRLAHNVFGGQVRIQSGVGSALKGARVVDNEWSMYIAFPATDFTKFMLWLESPWSCGVSGNTFGNFGGGNIGAIKVRGNVNGVAISGNAFAQGSQRIVFEESGGAPIDGVTITGNTRIVIRDEGSPLMRMCVITGNTHNGSILLSNVEELVISGNEASVNVTGSNIVVVGNRTYGTPTVNATNKVVANNL